MSDGKGGGGRIGLYPEWMQLETAANYADVDCRTVECWINIGLRCVTVHGSPSRIKRSDLDEWIARGATTDEPLTMETSPYPELFQGPVTLWGDWTDPKKELPEDGERVLIAVRGRAIKLAINPMYMLVYWKKFYRKMRWYRGDQDGAENEIAPERVIAWCKLPEIPKELIDK